MGFWVFMLICDMLTPVVMIGIGSGFERHPPKKINPVMGFRTSMSMKNMDTWVFAHKHAGRTWRVWGLWMLPISLAVMLAVLGRDTDFVGIVGGVLMGAQCAAMIAAIIPTQLALKKTFDPDGKRRGT